MQTLRSDIKGFKKILLFIILAWRNIWRNKRRTFITAGSIFLAVFLALFMRSMQLGSYSHIIDNIVHSYSGYIQIHRKGYWNERTIDISFAENDTLIDRLEHIPDVTAVVPRLESVALASSGLKTKGVMVVGILPGTEEKLTGMKEKVITGSYLSGDDKGILVAKNVAKFMGLHVNDTLVMIGQGFHGASAAGKFPVRGILHFSSPNLDNQLVILTLPACQDFYDAGNNITSLALNLDDPERISKTMSAVKRVTGTRNYEVMDWREMMVEVVNLIKADSSSGLIMLGILYIVVGFGIFGTVLMMSMERIKEFGVMVSIGTQKAILSFMVVLETVFIGILGILLAVAASIPPILYYHHHPIHLAGEAAKSTEGFGFEALLSFQPPDVYFINTTLMILLIVLLSSVYPVRKIIRMKVMNALRNKI